MRKATEQHAGRMIRLLLNSSTISIRFCRRRELIFHPVLPRQGFEPWLLTRATILPVSLLAARPADQPCICCGFVSLCLQWTRVIILVSTPINVFAYRYHRADGSPSARPVRQLCPDANYRVEFGEYGESSIMYSSLIGKDPLPRLDYLSRMAWAHLHDSNRLP